MDMIRTSMQVPSINDFTCRQFQQLFSENNKNGLITTTENGRTYHAVWDTSTDTLSVKRDLTNVDGWTRFTETIQRWSRLDFTTHAEKWESRLTIQKHNVALANPLRTPVSELLLKLDSIDTCIEPRQYPSKAIQDQLNQIIFPLTRLLEEKRSDLTKQTQQLSCSVNEDVVNSQLWTQQQNVKGALNNLQLQAQQLQNFIESIRNTMRSYCAAAGSIDVSANSIIYDALTTRLSFIGIKIRLMLDTYFTAGGNISKEEVTRYNTMIKTEEEIARTFHSQQVATHFTYNELLSPPSYESPEGADAQHQEKVRFNYQKHIFTFTNALVDTTQTFADIQTAADELKLVRHRWQEQIYLEQKIGQLLVQIRDKEESHILYPIHLRHREQLRELKKNLFSKGELLGLVSFELLQSDYRNIERANALYLDIDHFLKDLPGFINFCQLSNYNNEMQSRIFHLTLLRKMCREDEALTGQALDHMAHFIKIHKNVIRQWTDSEAFSRLNFYDPIPDELTYPKWLVKEHDLFHQKSQQIMQTLWETKYQLLRNEELLKIKEQLSEKLEGKTEELEKVAERFEEAARKLHHKHSVTARISDYFRAKKDQIRKQDNAPVITTPD